MPEKNGHNNAQESSSDLNALDAKLRAAKARQPQEKEQSSDGSMLGMAWRLSTELIVSVLVGTFLGLGLDKLLGTSPWITLVGVGFGFAAGIKAVLRTSDAMNAIDSGIPIGNDIPDVPDEDDL